MQNALEMTDAELAFFDRIEWRACVSFGCVDDVEPNRDRLPKWLMAIWDNIDGAWRDHFAEVAAERIGDEHFNGTRTNLVPWGMH